MIHAAFDFPRHPLAREDGERFEAFVPFGTTEGVIFGFAGAALPPQLSLVARRVEDVPQAKQRAERFFARRYGMAWKERVNVVATSTRDATPAHPSAGAVFACGKGDMTDLLAMVYGVIGFVGGALVGLAGSALGRALRPPRPPEQ